MRVHRRTDLVRDGLAWWLNPIVAGWLNYCGRFYRSAMLPLSAPHAYLTRWAGMEYRRMRPFGKARGWTSALAAWPVRLPGRVLGPWPSRDHGTFPIKTSRERSAPPTNYRCETVRNPLTLNRSSS